MNDNRKKNLVLYFSLFLVAVAVRMLPWVHVFDSGKVYLYDPDCYMRLRKILVYLHSFPATAVYDFFEGFPKGTGVISPPTLEYLIAAMLYPFRGVDSLALTLEKAVALAPPLIGGATVVLLYRFAKEQFEKTPALLTALFLAFSPPHIEATLLGRFDNEMLEPLLLVATYWSYVKTFDAEIRAGKWINLGMVSALFLMSWRGALFPLAIIGIHILYRVFQSRSSGIMAGQISRGAAIQYFVLFSIFASVCTADVWGTRHLFSYNIISWFHVVLFGLASLILFSISLLSCRSGLVKMPGSAFLLSTVLLGASAIILLESNILRGIGLFGRTDPWLNTVMEYQPLLQTGMSVEPLLFLYGVFFLISPVFLLLFSSRVFDAVKAKSFFVISTGILFFAFVARQRFAPLYAVNAALMVGVVIFYITERPWGRSSRKVIAVSVTALLLFQIATVSYLFRVYKHGAGYSIKGDLEEALLWLRDNTPNPGNPYEPGTAPTYGVLARWDYGGWIESVAQRPVVATNYGTETYGMEEVAGFVLSSDEGEMAYILQKNKVRYVLTDKISHDLSMYAQLLGRERSFFVKRWNQELKRETYVPTKEYYSLISSRLFYADGSMKVAGPTTFYAIEGLRLVHETGSLANVYGFPWEIRKLKIFEYGKGVTVLITGVPGKPVTLSQTIETNQGRQFEYNNKKAFGEDGMVSFVVPYAQKADPFSVGAIRPAVFSDGKSKLEITLSDSDREQGKMFRLSFIK